MGGQRTPRLLTETSFQGHDCCPMLFNYDDRGCLTFVSKLDIPKQSIQRNMSAMERFRNMDKRATTEDRNTALETLHQNSITYVPPRCLGPLGATFSQGPDHREKCLVTKMPVFLCLFPDWVPRQVVRAVCPHIASGAGAEGSLKLPDCGLLLSAWDRVSRPLLGILSFEVRLVLGIPCEQL